MQTHIAFLCVVLFAAGVMCQPAVNECATSNGGCDPQTTCTDTVDGYTCGCCPPGWIDSEGCTQAAATSALLPPNECYLLGPLAELLVCAATPSYCNNSLTVMGGCICPDCEPSMNFSCSAFGYVECPIYPIFHCIVLDEECNTNCTRLDFCSPNQCLNNSTCSTELDDEGMAYISCACLPGYEGYTCQSNINECASSPCANGGMCWDGVDSFSCVCPSNYSGDLCQTPAAP